MKIIPKLSLVLMGLVPFYSSTSLANKLVKESKDQVLQDIVLKGKKHFQIVGSAEGKVFFTVTEGQEVKHKVEAKQVTIAPLKSGHKLREETELPVIELKKLESFSGDVDFVSIVISPTEPQSEIAVQTNQIQIIKDDRIIEGPGFESIGMGEGGVLREFDFSKLKKSKKILILQWLDKESQAQFAKANIIRKDTMGGESYAVAVDETYIWNGKGFDKKSHLEQ